MIPRITATLVIFFPSSSMSICCSHEYIFNHRLVTVTHPPGATNIFNTHWKFVLTVRVDMMFGVPIRKDYIQPTKAKSCLRCSLSPDVAKALSIGKFWAGQLGGQLKVQVPQHTKPCSRKSRLTAHPESHPASRSAPTHVMGPQMAMGDQPPI